MRIRKYENKDKEDVRYICLNCDEPFDGPESARVFFLSLFCDYYIEREPDNCFVVVDDADVAVGYIICTENYTKFKSVFLEDYSLRIDEKDTKGRKAAREAIEAYEIFCDDYPAHFHIDILPDYQRMGLGHKLMGTLVEHLKGKNVKGIMLSVWNRNKKGIAFYEKYGFAYLCERQTEVIYGLRLD